MLVGKISRHLACYLVTPARLPGSLSGRQGGIPHHAHLQGAVGWHCGAPPSAQQLWRRHLQPVSLTSVAGVYGGIADGGIDIMRGRGIGPLSKWVDDHFFMCIKLTFLEEFNQRRVQVAARIEASGGHHQTHGWYW